MSSDAPNFQHLGLPPLSQQHGGNDQSVASVFSGNSGSMGLNNGPLTRSLESLPAGSNYGGFQLAGIVPAGVVPYTSISSSVVPQNQQSSQNLLNTPLVGLQQVNQNVNASTQGSDQGVPPYTGPSFKSNGGSNSNSFVSTYQSVAAVGQQSISQQHPMLSATGGHNHSSHAGNTTPLEQTTSSNGGHVQIVHNLHPFNPANSMPGQPTVLSNSESSGKHYRGGPSYFVPPGTKGEYVQPGTFSTIAAGQQQEFVRDQRQGVPASSMFTYTTPSGQQFVQQGPPQSSPGHVGRKSGRKSSKKYEQTKFGGQPQSMVLPPGFTVIQNHQGQPIEHHGQMFNPPPPAVTPAMHPHYQNHDPAVYATPGMYPHQQASAVPQTPFATPFVHAQETPALHYSSMPQGRQSRNQNGGRRSRELNVKGHSVMAPSPYGGHQQIIRNDHGQHFVQPPQPTSSVVPQDTHIRPTPKHHTTFFSHKAGVAGAPRQRPPAGQTHFPYNHPDENDPTILHRDTPLHSAVNSLYRALKNRKNPDPWVAELENQLLEHEMIFSESGERMWIREDLIGMTLAEINRVCDGQYNGPNCPRLAKVVGDLVIRQCEGWKQLRTLATALRAGVSIEKIILSNRAMSDGSMGNFADVVASTWVYVETRSWERVIAVLVEEQNARVLAGPRTTPLTPEEIEVEGKELRNIANLLMGAVSHSTFLGKMCQYSGAWKPPKLTLGHGETAKRGRRALQKGALLLFTRARGIFEEGTAAGRFTCPKDVSQILHSSYVLLRPAVNSNKLDAWTSGLNEGTSATNGSLTGGPTDIWSCPSSAVDSPEKLVTFITTFRDAAYASFYSSETLRHAQRGDLTMIGNCLLKEQNLENKSKRARQNGTHEGDDSGQFVYFTGDKVSQLTPRAEALLNEVECRGPDWFADEDWRLFAKVGKVLNSRRTRASLDHQNPQSLEQMNQQQESQQQGIPIGINSEGTIPSNGTAFSEGMPHMMEIQQGGLMNIPANSEYNNGLENTQNSEYVTESSSSGESGETTPASVSENNTPKLKHQTNDVEQSSTAAGSPGTELEDGKQEQEIINSPRALFKNTSSNGNTSGRRVSM